MNYERENLEERDAEEQVEEVLKYEDAVEPSEGQSHCSELTEGPKVPLTAEGLTEEELQKVEEFVDAEVPQGFFFGHLPEASRQFTAEDWVDLSEPKDGDDRA